MADTPFILITGASSGIGGQIATGLSRDHNLILHGRNAEKLEAVRQKCVPGKRVLTWVYDLNQTDGLEAAAGELLAKNEVTAGGFIHCAGVLKMRAFRSYSLQNIEETLRVNFTSSALIIKTLINRRINGGSLSNVIFISSTASLFGAKAFSVYSATKGALDSFMRCLAVELAPEVRVNSVLPGAIRTEMTDRIFQDETVIARMKADYPLGFGTPSDIFEMVNFLLSEKARWITGQQFIVDGGRTINISG
jgi:NAD(P)-dependent dehydrogenase (short-subunit alcohol dehydrogenase family)